MLVEPDGPASETNVWDREFTWTLMNQMTSANDGSELRTFAYDDTGALMIQDGSLLTRDGDVLAERGGGPETIFLNAWVTIVSQKIYKNINDGLDKIATKMDADAAFETKSLYLHNDLVGSTNIVTDNQGRGFQRHEYFPSGEIWISDHKEEIRTPFQFGDGYYEEHFEIVLFGGRWYDTERELFLAPDPLLSADPRATIDRRGSSAPTPTPEPLRSSTSTRPGWTSSAPTTGGREGPRPGGVRPRAVRAQDHRRGRHRPEEGRPSARSCSTSKPAPRRCASPTPSIKIDLNEGTVSLGPPYGPRKEWSMNGGNSGSQAAPTADAQDSANSKSDDSLDATDDSGGPNAGDDSSVAGSARVSVSARRRRGRRGRPRRRQRRRRRRSQLVTERPTGRPTTLAGARPARRRRRRRQPRRQLTDSPPRLASSHAKRSDGSTPRASASAVVVLPAR